MESSKPTRQAPAGQKVAELLFDESGQAFAVAQRRRLEAERVEVCDDNLVKDAVSGIPRLIAAGRLRHSTREGEPRANG